LPNEPPHVSDGSILAAPRLPKSSKGTRNPCVSRERCPIKGSQRKLWSKLGNFRPMKLPTTNRIKATK